MTDVSQLSFVQPPTHQGGIFQVTNSDAAQAHLVSAVEAAQARNFLAPSATQDFTVSSPFSHIPGYSKLPDLLKILLNADNFALATPPQFATTANDGLNGNITVVTHKSKDGKAPHAVLSLLDKLQDGALLVQSKKDSAVSYLGQWQLMTNPDGMIDVQRLYYNTLTGEEKLANSSLNLKDAATNLIREEGKTGVLGIYTQFMKALTGKTQDVNWEAHVVKTGNDSSKLVLSSKLPAGMIAVAEFEVIPQNADLPGYPGHIAMTDLVKVSHKITWQDPKKVNVMYNPEVLHESVGFYLPVPLDDIRPVAN